MIIIVDASVAIKWYEEEIDSAKAAELLVGGHILVAPAHVFGEIGEALTRRVRARAISRDQLEAALIGAKNSVASAPLPELLSDAAAVALEASVSYYDALYVAAALRWSAPLVTTDEKLLRKLSKTRWSSNARHLDDLGVMT